MSRRHDWAVEQEVSVLLSASSQDEALRVERPVSHSSIKKIRDTKGTLHSKMGSIKDRNSMDLTEAEEIKQRWRKCIELPKKIMT